MHFDAVGCTPTYIDAVRRKGPLVTEAIECNHMQWYVKFCKQSMKINVLTCNAMQFDKTMQCSAVQRHAIHASHRKSQCVSEPKTQCNEYATQYISDAIPEQCSYTWKQRSRQSNWIQIQAANAKRNASHPAMHTQCNATHTQFKLVRRRNYLKQCFAR